MERYQKEESPGDITAIAEKIKGWIDLRKKVIRRGQRYPTVILSSTTSEKEGFQEMLLK